MASVKTDTREIAGKEVTILYLDTITGIKLSTKLIKFALPAYAQLLNILRSEGGDVKSAIAEVVSNIDEIDLAEMCQVLLEGATIDAFPVGKDLNYFRGDLGTLIDVIAYALEINFKSVFTATAFSSVLGSITAN